MAMTDMKGMTGGMDCCCPSEQEYPYNLRISITEDQLEKLGIPMPTVGDTITLTANCNVSECSDSEYRAVTLQITEMDLGKAKKKSSMYPTMDADPE